MDVAGDYERELVRQEPWLGNLLRHEPDVGEAGQWRAVGLALELDRACREEIPELVAAIDRRTGGKLDSFFLQLARQLLSTLPEAALRRDQLASIVARAAGGLA